MDVREAAGPPTVLSSLARSTDAGVNAREETRNFGFREWGATVERSDSVCVRTRVDGGGIELRLLQIAQARRLVVRTPVRASALGRCFVSGVGTRAAGDMQGGVLVAHVGRYHAFYRSSCTTGDALYADVRGRRQEQGASECD